MIEGVWLYGIVLATKWIYLSARDVEPESWGLDVVTVSKKNTSHRKGNKICAFSQTVHVAFGWCDC